MRSSVASIFGSRLDPGRFSASDRRQIGLVHHVLKERQRPALVGATGERIELPEPLFALLCHVVDQVQSGQAVVLVPEHELLTTQAAANYLGMSRPYLIKLLESGKIPFEKVGTHRRIRFGDLTAFARRRTEARRTALGSLTRQIEEAGLYDR